jgi:hypothetical protein
VFSVKESQRSSVFEVKMYVSIFKKKYLSNHIYHAPQVAGTNDINGLEIKNHKNKYKSFQPTCPPLLSTISGVMQETW